jgi:hypothetical protein
LSEDGEEGRKEGKNMEREGGRLARSKKNLLLKIANGDQVHISGL